MIYDFHVNLQFLYITIIVITNLVIFECFDLVKLSKRIAMIKNDGKPFMFLLVKAEV